MKVRHLVIAISVAAFGFLAFVFSTWIKELSMESVTKQIGNSKQFLYAVPTSSSVCLDAVKSKLSSIGMGIASVFASPHLLPQFKSVGSFEQNRVAVDIPRPLWLLHRSLLI
jgi:hypothetical protein